MSTETAKPRLTFAKIAASASSRPLTNNSVNHNAKPSVAVPLPPKPREPMTAMQDATAISEKEGHINGVDMDKFTPRPAKSTPVQFGQFQDVITSDYVKPAALLPTNDKAPISEENVTRLPSIRAPVSNLSFDGKSTTSGTTFPLDEKESLRPDDSASVNAQEDDDGQGSTQPSSRVGSDPDARAFSEQLREISIMGPPPARPPINMAPQANHSAPALLFQPTPMVNAPTFQNIGPNLAGPTSTSLFAPDEKLLEALNSVRDRVWVLKLEQDITDFVKDPIAQSFDLPNCNSFYRMLAHKMADYYYLGHTMNDSSSGVRLYKTPNCRIPPRLSEVTNPSTAASTPPPSLPQMKILRRADTDTRPSSRDGQADADSGSEVGKGKFPATREEREARYEAARLRILGSAKPSEDAAAAPPPPKESDSNSNSVIGKRKKKQRSDSEDGFEARSAYSMYPQSSAAQSSHHGANGNPSVGYNMQAQFLGQGVGYGVIPDLSRMDQQWMAGPYAQQYPQAHMWNQSQFGGYDLSAQMQHLSFQQQQQESMAFQGTADLSNGGAYGSPGRSQALPMYQAGYPSYTGQYSAALPSQSHGAQPYPYGAMLGPSGVASGHKNSDHNQFLTGGHNRPFFNPQSQTFVPGQAPPSFGRPQFQPGLASPAMSNASAAHVGPQNLQRQYSSHSSNGHQLTPPQAAAQHNSQRQNISPSNLQNMTHPLPQPVFSHLQHSHSPVTPPREKVPASAKKKPPAPQPSTIAKFTNGAILPPKPPPSIVDATRVPPYYAQAHNPDNTRR